MKKRVLMASALLCAGLGAKAQNVAVATGQYTPDWESLSAWECPEWFKDAKFGIWAHWGPQCQAEDGDWYGRGMYFAGSGQYNWHVSHFGDPAEFGLKDLCNTWKAEKWDPERLVALYKSVGARYFFTLGQHHDNFDLWNSPYQEWNSVNVGPKRDIVKEWSDACKKNGLPLGVSMHGSHTWTWLEIAQEYDGNLTKEDGVGKWWEGLDPQELYAQRHEPSVGYTVEGSVHGQWDWTNGASLPSEEYKIKFQNRVLQCVNDYRPDILYFDDTVLPFYGCDEQIGLNILAHTYNTIAEPVVTGKKLEGKHKRSMLWDVERGVPDKMQDEYWQTCTCIGSWHYDQGVYNNNSYKSAQQVVDMLVDIVSKNGNLLLSVPVKGDGSIDDKEEAILAGIKAWMDQNSRSVYGTRTWKTFGEGPLAEASNALTGQGFNENNNYSARDVRYVQKGDTLFATIMRWPSSRAFTFQSLGRASEYYSGKVESIKLLGSEAQVEYVEDIDGLTVTMPEAPVNEIAPVYAITFVPGTDAQLTLAEAVEHYDQKVIDIQPLVGYNTGNISRTALKAFQAAIDEARGKTEASDNDQKRALQTLHAAWKTLKNDGRVGVVAPSAGSDMTVSRLNEAKGFARLDESVTTRFATPKYWTVENFMIPNGDDGTKNGLDKYAGSDALMLGIWNDRDNNQEGDLHNARIYQKVHLEEGHWFFGAAYNANYQLNDDAYIFVSPEIVTTEKLPDTAIAYYPIKKMSNAMSGLTFTLDKEMDVYVGFQANLADGSGTQEFRADEVSLVYYGEIELSELEDLAAVARDLVADSKIDTNTGHYSQAAVDALLAVVEQVDNMSDDISFADLEEMYQALTKAIDTFQTTGRNAGGAPSEAGHKDMTVEVLSESTAFARTDDTQSNSRYATPFYWTVENYNIPSGQGNRNGLDHWPGYDCLSLGIWGDKGQNIDGNISNARIYQTVHLKPGRWYFGAKYQTTYNLNNRAYIFAADETLATEDIPGQSIAFYAINNAGESDGKWHGITFSLTKEQDVVLGFQADMDNGAGEQEFRASEVALYYYGEVTVEKVMETAAQIEEMLATVKVNANTGYYSEAAVQTLRNAIADAKALAATDVEEANGRLNAAYSDFLAHGKNLGGEPDKIGATDITVDKLKEASEFARTEETSANSRYATPLYWTVENYNIASGQGDRNGIDRYPGYNCLSLGIWGDRHNNQEGDLHDARIYQTVHLAPGRYYFGAAYEAHYNLHQAYIFAADAALMTDEIETETIAYDNLNNARNDGKTYGIYFTLDEAKDVLLGFQANMAEGAGEQEFRATSVTLLGYDIQEEDAVATVSAQPVSIECYTVGGMRLTRPMRGANIIVTTMSDGTRVNKKLLVK